MKFDGIKTVKIKILKLNNSDKVWQSQTFYINTTNKLKPIFNTQANSFNWNSILQMCTLHASVIQKCWGTLIFFLYEDFKEDMQHSLNET